MNKSQKHATRMNPYDELGGNHSKPGMSLIETVLWLIIMAVLTVGMIWLMGTRLR